MFGKLFQKTSTSAPVSTEDRARRHAAIVAAQVDAEDLLRRDLSALDVDGADRRCRELYGAWESSVGELQALKSREAQRHQAYDRQRVEAERELTALADPRIDAFLDWIQREVDGLNLKLVTTEGVGPRDSRGHRPVIIGSNRAVIRVICDALVEARRLASALKLVTVSDVEGALDDLRRAIPSLESAETTVQASGATLAPAS